MQQRIKKSQFRIVSILALMTIVALMAAFREALYWILFVWAILSPCLFVLVTLVALFMIIAFAKQKDGAIDVRDSKFAKFVFYVWLGCVALMILGNVLFATGLMKF